MSLVLSTQAKLERRGHAVRLANRPKDFPRATQIPALTLTACLSLFFGGTRRFDSRRVRARGAYAFRATFNLFSSSWSTGRGQPGRPLPASRTRPQPPHRYREDFSRESSLASVGTYPTLTTHLAGRVGSVAPTAACCIHRTLGIPPAARLAVPPAGSCRLSRAGPPGPGRHACLRQSHCFIRFIVIPGCPSKTAPREAARLVIRRTRRAQSPACRRITTGATERRDNHLSKSW